MGIYIDQADDEAVNDYFQWIAEGMPDPFRPADESARQKPVEDREDGMPF